MTSMRTGLLGFAAVLLHLTAHVKGICDFSRLSGALPINTTVRWLPEQQRCEPNICNGIRLDQVPDASGHLPVSLFCSLDVQDSAGALECLRGKYIVMFGDSTLEENMYDLILLLSGTPQSSEVMDTFIKAAVGSAAKKFRLPVQGDSQNTMLVILHATARNVTIHVPSHDLLIWFRFTGHANVWKNFMGISTFFNSSFLAESLCMVDNIGPGCPTRHPDFLIVNTGAHDDSKSLDEFAHSMRRLASWLAGIRTRHGTRIIWRGSNPVGLLRGYDLVARPYLEAEGIEVLDLNNIFDLYKEDLQSGCCSDAVGGIGLHVGVLAKYWHNKNPIGARVTVSSMLTQAMLTKMTDRAHWTRHLRLAWAHEKTVTAVQ